MTERGSDQLLRDKAGDDRAAMPVVADAMRIIQETELLRAVTPTVNEPGVEHPDRIPAEADPS